MSKHEECIQACKEFSKALAEYDKRMENERKWRFLIEQSKNKKPVKVLRGNFYG